MSSSPLFSIVIPTYRGSDSLFIALESINRQTYKNIEVIVSDDNGQGTEYQTKTQKVVEKYKSVLNIRYLINNHVNGSHARNKGMKIAEGEYISFLDDDDFYLETYVEDAINSLKDNDMLFFDVVIISENTCKKISSNNINSKDLLFYKQELGTGSNICIKRKVAEEGNLFDERYLRHQDIEFVAKLLSKYKFNWINKVNIVKYFNNIDNYPQVDKALAMQKLLRDDMLENNIINKEDYEKLKLNQLHSLFNDYLVKGVSKETLAIVYGKLKELNDMRMIDRCMYHVYKISKNLFKKCFTIYARRNLQDRVEKDKYLDYRYQLESEALKR